MATQVELPEDSHPGEEEAVAEENASILLSPEALIKHPLQNKWALWFFKNDRTKEWTANLKLVTSFDTVEDFWALYNHVQKASKLPSGCDYSLFKDGIQPMWEDAQNKDGGRWLINLNKQQRHSDLDNFWLETLLCLIGESFEEFSDDVNGAVVNVRNKGDKLSLWTRDATRPDAIMKIGKKLKDSLKIPIKIAIGFQAHTDTMTKTGSTARDRFRV
ncbi:eukaryotic translation initiation factor 4E-like [Mizuhopecten yessoensis]|uniref:Eukaryotic translation initiation factor 4E n=1 Tax=Mizuhopecten yessoensis TaxID=6573 RepID=A0A210PSB7_MIZYE|nr:eukaryotic translation initiation factor 4E-like [Mizuhopecten yessoensis]OWF39380.1 Eukaryotic translation initiation factor 4E [Mizuhopecten yessoensis]